MAASALFAPLYMEVARFLRGGWRQQRQQDKEQGGRETTLPAKLAMGHLLEWADGVQSASQVQQHMANAVHDGIDDPLVSRLNQIGGVSHLHSHAKLMTLVGELPLMNIITTIAASSWTHIILPSSWITLLLRFSPRDFRIRLGADKRKVNAFWDVLFQSPVRRAWAQQHASLRGKTSEDLYTAVPLAVHEDAGPCAKKLSARCLSFSGVLGEGSEKLTNFLCASAISSTLGMCSAMLRSRSLAPRPRSGNARCLVAGSELYRMWC